ncbi:MULTISPECIES: SDR family NAD(P)-dependent oxidoreductase [Streptosporangium]|uniref:NAD(P)-dependent dehydrogenase (Short-subunit alcohol dehydrogenase family) n=1 Tax=Streptosporangium brasiliense TaxID=47480 RepID=A0ABT9RG22_9ACTN|nr:SDR family oxidoreductase [Streptosporangium brasiliense]MDP9868199.1 NAD(P)-dependent dehydrogenase (short-subunit alcohol dehydrogenase family) [Streptosporangium brasiliense]
MTTLTGKTALVTGGSRGIGRAVAIRLAREGARVAVHYGNNETAAKETVAAIETAGGQAFAVRAELGVPADAQALWAGFDAHADGLDILVNNAGILGDQTEIDGVTREGFERLFAVNTTAPFFITQLALPRLRDGGRIITVGTMLTRGAAMPRAIDYAMSKAALDVLTQALAKQLGPRGITVNTVAPGVIDTDMHQGRLVGEALAWLSSQTPLHRLGTPEDVAGTVAFLASDDSRYVTGHRLDVSGGTTM